MASRPLDIVARFRTVTTEFNTRKIEQELDDTGRAFDKSERDAKRWSKRLKDEADDAGQGVKKELGEAGKEVGAEFAQNVGEGLASGNLEDLAADSAGGLVSAFQAIGGPIGVVLAGVAASAAAVFSAIRASAEQARDDALSALAEIDEGLDNSARIRSAYTQLFGDEITGRQKVSEIVARTGISEKKVIDYLVTGKMTAKERVDLEKRAADLRLAGVRAVSNEEKEAIGAQLYSVELLIDSTRRRGAANNEALKFTQQETRYLRESEGYSTPMADAAERAANARMNDAKYAADLAQSLKKAAYYAKEGSSYRIGGSTYNSQVPTAARREP